MSEQRGLRAPFFMARRAAPAKRDAAPASAPYPPGTARRTVAQANIRRLGGAAVLARILGSVHQQATNRQESLAEKPAPSFFRNQLPTIPWDAAKPLIHGLPETLITKLAHRLIHRTPRQASTPPAPFKIGTAPALKQTTTISGASVQAGWGIPLLHPAAGAASARNRHTRFGDLGTGRLRTPLFYPGGTAIRAPPSRLGTSVQAG